MSKSILTGVLLSAFTAGLLVCGSTTALADELQASSFKVDLIPVLIRAAGGSEYHPAGVTAAIAKCKIHVTISILPTENPTRSWELDKADDGGSVLLMPIMIGNKFVFPARSCISKKECMLFKNAVNDALTSGATVVLESEVFASEETSKMPYDYVGSAYCATDDFVMKNACKAVTQKEIDGLFVPGVPFTFSVRKPEIAEGEKISNRSDKSFGSGDSPVATSSDAATAGSAR